MRIPRFVISLDEALSDKRDAIPKSVIEKLPKELGTEPKPLSQVICLTDNNYHHLVKVLRRQPGDRITIIDRTSSKAYLSTIVSIESSAAYVVIAQLATDAETSGHHSLILLQGISRGSVCDFIVEKAVELGVSDVHFFRAERSQYSAAKLRERQDRLARKATAANKQSGQKSALKIEVFDSLEQAFVHAHGRKPETNLEPSLSLNSEIWRLLLSAPTDSDPEDAARRNQQVPIITSFLSTSAQTPSRSPEILTDVLENNQKYAETYLLVGPEGGLDNRECALARNWGYVETSLGANTLRTETAVIVACGLIQLMR